MLDQRTRDFIDEFVAICKKHEVGIAVYVDEKTYCISIWDSQNDSGQGLVIDEPELSEFKGRLTITV